MAVENAKVNFKNLGFTIPAYQGDVFSGIPSGKTYDAVFWNHPFHRGQTEETEILLQSIFDFEYRALERYIAESDDRISPSGRLFLGTATMAEMPYIEELAKRYGRTAVEISRSKCDMACNDFDLTCLILELKRE
jgi:16S rRNA G1207 methylase RsmC